MISSQQVYQFVRQASSSVIDAPKCKPRALFTIDQIYSP